MVKIYLDNKGIESIMKSEKISLMEQNIMMSKLDQIKSSFLQEFGFEGKFEIKSETTSGTIRLNNKLHGGRTSYRIVAADAKTTAVLKSHQGWLDKFIY